MGSGNPNIIEDTKGKQTGPKTELGKLKSSMNLTRKYSGAALQISKNDKVINMMKDIGIKFANIKEAVELKDMFVAWFNSRTTKEITEINMLEQVNRILESEMSSRVMWKLRDGLPLTDEDMKLIRLLKDCLESAHHLKFGTKNLNVHASYDDIRKMMFDDNPPSK